MTLKELKNYLGSDIDPIEIAKMYTEDRISIIKIQKHFHISEKKVKTVLGFYNIPIINKTQISKFNEHVFDNIDTEEKAYWLGFIFADGYISSSNYLFELSLSINDLSHLQKFAKFMQHRDPNHIIIDSHRCRWCIGSKYLWNVLNSYGCTPKKSLTLRFPNQSIFRNKNLIKHFIRGYIDGDGSISYRDKDHTDVNFTVLGTFEFLTVLQCYLPLKMKYVMFQRKLNVNTWTFRLNGGIGLYNLKYLYEDASIYLQRKKERYEEFMCLPRLKNLMENLGKIGELYTDNAEITEEINRLQYCNA